MKKIFMLFILMFLLTGCSVKYNIIINEDLTLTENAKLTGTSDFFANYYKTTKKNVLKSFIDIYKDILDENNYQYELKEDEVPYIEVNKKYDNVKNYVEKSILFNDYFEKVNYSENGNIKKIETVGFNNNEPDNPDRFDVKELEITIKCPYVVKNHNAKMVDRITNTYYYELNDDNNKILIEYDVSRKYNSNSDLINIIVICILIIIVLWMIVIYVNKKNNKKEK